MIPNPVVGRDVCDKEKLILFCCINWQPLYFCRRASASWREPTFMLEASVSSLVRWLELSCSSCRRLEFSIFSTSTCLSSWSYDAAAMLEEPRLTCTKTNRDPSQEPHDCSTELLKVHQRKYSTEMFVAPCLCLVLLH